MKNQMWWAGCKLIAREVGKKPEQVSWLPEVAVAQLLNLRTKEARVLLFKRYAQAHGR